MDDNQLYPIGDVARRTGLSVSAIRFYADSGVVAPTSSTSAGYRLYDVGAVARLELVRTLRELGANLDDIRQLLSDETTLRDLATTHLELVDGQLRQLRARRAVLRTIVNQSTATEQVTLMHNLVSMSDDDRNRLLDQFWDEITEGLHPSYIDGLHKMRPTLSEEPSTEQLQAWIELADLVQDKDFRDAVRQYFQSTFSSPRPSNLFSPSMVERAEKYLRIDQEACAAQQSGLSPDSPQAQEITERLLASIAELTAGATGKPLDEHDRNELRNSMALPDLSSTTRQAADQAVAEFYDLLGNFISLMATIDGTPQWDPQSVAYSDQWIAAVLTTSGPHQEPRQTH